MWAWVSLACLALSGCAAAIGGVDYPVTAPQFECARACFNIPPCPVGKTNLAGAVYTDAGGVVSVRCSVGDILK